MSAPALRLVPGGVVVLAAALAVAVPGAYLTVAPLSPALPYAAFAATALLAWRFERSRVMLLVLALAGADQAIRLTAGTPCVGTVTAAVAVLLPAVLVAVAWLPERGPLVAPLIWLSATLAVAAVIVMLLCQPEAAPAAAGLARRFESLAPAVRLPRAAVLTATLAVGLTAARALASRSPLEAGTFWAVLAAAWAMNDPRAARPALLLAAGAIALAVSLVETSHAIAYGDELTGLPARRALNETLSRLTGTYAIAMVDIDHFKRFNDTYGHDAGDQLLRMVGARLAAVSGGGRAFRYGGEEFAVIFEGGTVEESLPALETLRKSIETTGFALRGHGRPRGEGGAARRRGSAARTVSVSVSIGVADSTSRRGPRSVGSVVDAADAALYRAKRGGRNRICT